MDTDALGPEVATTPPAKPGRTVPAARPAPRLQVGTRFAASHSDWVRVGPHFHHLQSAPLPPESDFRRRNKHSARQSTSRRKATHGRSITKSKSKEVLAETGQGHPGRPAEETGGGRQAIGLHQALTPSPLPPGPQSLSENCEGCAAARDFGRERGGAGGASPKRAVTPATTTLPSTRTGPGGFSGKRPSGIVAPQSKRRERIPHS